MKYTRNTLADEVAARTGHLREDTHRIILAAVEIMAEALAGGGTVALQGLGTISAETREARLNYVPCAGETRVIPRRRRYKFVAGPKLRASGEEVRKQQETDVPR